jgi:hypothetical protein
MTDDRGGRIGLRRGATLATLCALLVPVLSSAQVRTPRAPGPRLPPAPAAIVTSAGQANWTIYPELRFELPPGTVGVRVQRKPKGGQAQLLTPTSLPAAKLANPSGAGYQWWDQTLTALGSYEYSVVAELDDGRQGPSAWFPYVPQLYEAINVRMTKLSSYNVQVEFNDGAVAGGSYRLFGTGIAATGEPAVADQQLYQDPTTRQLYRVWRVVRSGLAAGSYNWVLRAEFQPGLRTAGVPVSVVMP